MKIIYIEKSKEDVEKFSKIISKISYIDLKKSFSSSDGVLDYVMENEIDAVVLDISIDYSSGVILIEKLLKFNKNIVVVIITKDANLAIHAYEIGAIGYILKPYSNEDLISLMDKALSESKAKKQIKVNMFGGFSLSLNGARIYFDKSNVQEMLAFILHKRSKTVLKDEIMKAIYEKKLPEIEEKMLFKQMCLGIKTTFARFDLGDAFSYGKDYCSIDYRYIDCDYYSFLDGENIDISKPYLPEYKWSKISKKR